MTLFTCPLLAQVVVEVRTNPLRKLVSLLEKHCVRPAVVRDERDSEFNLGGEVRNRSGLAQQRCRRSGRVWVTNVTKTVVCGCTLASQLLSHRELTLGAVQALVRIRDFVVQNQVPVQVLILDGLEDLRPAESRRLDSVGFSFYSAALRTAPLHENRPRTRN